MSKRFVLTAAGASAAAICGGAAADVTVNFLSTDLLGGESTSIDMGSVSGTLTGIGYNYTWENSTGDSSWASDMLFGMSDGFWGVSVGGFNGALSSILSPAGASIWFSEGGINGSPDDGSYSGTVSFASGYSMSNTGTAYMANGWLTSAGTATSAEITFFGVNSVPAPGALALLGLAGLAGGRRRA